MVADSTRQTPLLQIRLFGAFDVRVGEQTLPPLRSRKGQWLLALLTLRHGREVARDWLASALWPDNEESQMLFYLRKSLSDLRRALGEEASRLCTPTSRTLSLNLSEAFADVAVFDQAIARGDPASLEKAVALYRGPLLEGCSEAWVLPERMTRLQSYLTALETLANHALARHDPATATRYLRLLITEDPLVESAHRALMQALAVDKDYAAAAQVYRDLRQMLRRDLNADPAPETTTLFQEIRAEEKAKSSRPAREAQSSVPSLTHAVVQTRHTSTLPRPLTDLIGREREVREIEARLLSARLVTLTGTGGIGKTRLAIRVAQSLEAKWREQLWFVDLAVLSDPALVLQSIAKAMDVQEQAGQSLLETILAALHSRDNRFGTPLLLVLDNCEHLLEACAQAAARLLEGAVHLRILATSRQSLGLTGEIVWRVASLSLPSESFVMSLDVSESKAKDRRQHSDKNLTAHLMEYEAVALFMERAYQVQPDFRLLPHNALAVALICQRLDGIPLAIELAAARLKALAVEEIAVRLNDRFQLLTGGNRAALPRQQTLRAALDWSYNLLTEAEQTLLHRLSVFAGGWTLSAVEAVTENGSPSVPDALDLLMQLVDKSLVVMETRREAVRYRLLETIRQYALEKLAASGEERSLRQAHRDFYLRMAEEAADKLRGAEQTAWLHRLETDHDNLRAALTFCRDEDADPEPGLRLAGALNRFWTIRAYLEEAKAWYAALLAKDRLAEPTIARAQALEGAGTMAYTQHDYVAAAPFYQEALAIRQQIGDRQGMAIPLGSLGNIAQYQGDHARACALFEEALAIYREAGNADGEATNLTRLANATRELGDYTRARAYYEQALERNRKTANRYLEATILSHRGLLSMELGDFVSAQHDMEQALALHREQGDPISEAACLSNLGSMARQQSDYALAQSYFVATAEIARAIGLRRQAAIVLEEYGHMAADQNQAERAVCLLASVEALREAIAAPRPPNERDAYEANVVRQRAHLGEDAFAAAWMRGHSLTWEQALEYAETEETTLPGLHIDGGKADRV